MYVCLNGKNDKHVIHTSPTDLGGSPGGKSGQHWVLDPIDGTRGFVGMRQYSVCLGMLQDGEVELGVLGCPNLPLVRGRSGGRTHREKGLGTSRPAKYSMSYRFMSSTYRFMSSYVRPLPNPSRASGLSSTPNPQNHPGPDLC